LIDTLEDVKAAEIEVEHCYYLTNSDVSAESSFVYIGDCLGTYPSET